MKRVLVATLVALVALSSAATAQQGPNNEAEVKQLMDAGARAYREGRYEEAQQSFERVLALDPAQQNAPLYLARAIHRQYRPGDETPENKAKGEQTVEAYRRLWTSDQASPKQREEAFNAIASLYNQLREEEKEKEWQLSRAEDGSVPDNKRAEAYSALALKKLNCAAAAGAAPKEAKAATVQGETKAAYQGDTETPAAPSLSPLAPADFARARNCLVEGISLVERAIELNRESANAWALKTNLLRERAKLAQMEGDLAAKADYERQAGETDTEYKRLSAAAPQSQSASSVSHGEVSRKVPVADVPPGGAAVAGQRGVNGGILNGKAVSKPAPVYPPAAKAARASGTVMVQVVLDEEGKVAEASATSGHPLLRAAAVEAVRQWRFTPTRLSGQPVKVKGHVVINFISQ